MMFQAIFDFVLLFLAIDAVITAWFYGSIFQEKREAWEALPGLFGELVGCPMCLSYHVAWIFTLLFWLPAQLLDQLPGNWALLALVPRTVLLIFAATDVVHWLQGERPVPVEEDDV